MNYQRIYNELCKPSTDWKDPPKGFFKHRIIPGSKGGKYEDGNVTLLSWKGHRLAHWLLHKIYPNDLQLRRPAYLMRGLSDHLNWSQTGSQSERGRKGGLTKTPARREASRNNGTKARNRLDSLSQAEQGAKCKGIPKTGKGAKGVPKTLTVSLHDGTVRAACNQWMHEKKTGYKHTWIPLVYNHNS